MKDDRIKCSLAAAACYALTQMTRRMTSVQSGMILSIYVHQFKLDLTDLNVRNSKSATVQGGVRLLRRNLDDGF